MNPTLLLCLVCCAAPLLVPALDPMPVAPGNDGQVLGMNPTMNQRSSLPYTDLVRGCSGWKLAAESGAPALASGEVLAVDAQGWPAALAPGRDARLELMTGQPVVLVDEPLLVLWHGAGDFADGTLVASQGAVSPLAEADGWRRALLTPTSATKPLLLTLTRITDPEDPVRDLHVIRDGYHDTWATDWFHHDFLAASRSVRVLRFLSGCDPMQMAAKAGIKPYDGELLEPQHFKTADHPFWGGEQIPLDGLLELCNRLDADPWLPLPPQCSDASIRMIAERCAARLAPHLRPYIEFGNEVWNSGGVYSTGYWYARWLGMRYLGVTDADMADWTVATRARIVGQCQRSLEWWDIFDDVYGSTGSVAKPFRRVLCTQAVATVYNTFYQEWWDAVAAQRGLTPAQLVDGFGIAPYFAMILGPRLKGTALNHGSPDWRTVDATWSDDQILDYVEGTVIPGMRGKVEAQRDDLASKGPGIPLICYEGGASLRITGDDILRNATSYTQAGLTAAEAQAMLAQLYHLADRLIVVNRHQRMYGAYQQYLTDWLTVGGGRLMCLLSDFQAASRNGSFGKLESTAQYLDDSAMPAWKYRAWIDWARVQHTDDAAPTAAITLPTVYASLPAELTYAVSDDGRSGLPVLASWRLGAAPVSLTGGSGLARTATIVASQPGDHHLELVLDDGVRRSRIDVPLRVLPQPHAPVIVSGPAASPALLVLPGTATLGVTVADADGDPVHCTWSVVEGPAAVDFSPNGTPEAATCQAVFAIAGSYTLRVTADDGGPLGPAVAEVSLMVHPVPTCTVRILAVDAVASEPNASPSSGTARLRLLRSGSTEQAITVPLTLSGTATPDADCAGLPAAVTLPAGATTAWCTVTALTDVSDEAPETLAVGVVAGPGFAVDPTPALITILDAGPQVVSVTVVDALASEPNAEPAQGNGIWRIRRSGSLGNPLVVRYALGGTAQPGSDLAELPGTAVIAAGRATVDVTVRPLTDAEDEEDESVAMDLLPDDAYAIVPQAIPATIAVSDAGYGLPTVRMVALDALASEPGADQGTARLRLTRTGSLHAALVVPYAVSGTAGNSLDYARLPGSQRVAPGRASVDLVVQPLVDALEEGPETVIIDLSGSEAALVDPQAGTVVVEIADGPLTAGG